MAKEFTLDEVKRHCTETDCWIVIDGDVYDVTKFFPMHPGGKSVILAVAGKDATEDFYGMHRKDVLAKYQRLIIGRIAGSKPKAPVDLGALSKVPYAESSFWLGMKSPYFKPTHIKFRQEVRKFFNQHVVPAALASEEAGKAPTNELFKTFGAASMFATRCGPGEHLKAFQLPGGLKPEEFDYFHAQIMHEEMHTFGCPGFSDGLGAGLVIGLPPVMHFAPKALKDKIVHPVLSGEKKICLAITEPFAGSDVAGIKTTAVKSECGKFYIVTGTKKWITNGTFSDYFTTAVRTGPAGMGGISLLLIERGPGVETQLIKTAYSPAAGTAYVTFDQVKVPVENLLGEENKGFACIMKNFNYERWMIIVGVIRACRLVIEESFKWSVQRKVFGKPLISQPVIRAKLADMSAQTEAVYSWMEAITFQMNNMSYEEQARFLSGPIALLKYQCTRVSLHVSESACQIFGGRAITRNGMGQVIERFQRSIKYGAILGGSEEIMADLGMKQALKYFPRNAKL